MAHGVVVLGLVDRYLGKGYTVDTDSYYTSPLLCEDLLHKGIYPCGNLRTNRKHFPKFFDNDYDCDVRLRLKSLYAHSITYNKIAT